MTDAQPLHSTDVDQWLLENFPTAKGAKDAYDTFSAYLYGSDIYEHDDGDNDSDAKCDSSDEEDRKAVELALTWHATSTPPPLLERYLGLGLRRSSATSEARPIIPTHGTGSASSTADVPPSTKTLLERMSCENPSKPEWRSSSRTDQREEGSASSTADVPASTATLLERMSCGNPAKVEWRSNSRTNQREEFLRQTARGYTPSVLQELPTNRPSDRRSKDAKASDNSRGGSRGPPPWTAASYRRSDDSVRNHGPGRDFRYDQPRRGGAPERFDSTASHMHPRSPYAAARKDTPQPPRRPTYATAPSAPPSLQPAEASPVPAAQNEQRVSISQPEEAQLELVQSPATPESYLLLATDPTSRGLMARIYKLMAIAYMYRTGSVRMQHVINALCLAYQSTDPASQPAFNPPAKWHEAMVEAFLPKMLVDLAEEDTRDVANELFETILEIEKAIEERVQPPPLRKYLVVALILYIEHLIEFGAETIEQMKDWPRSP